MGGGCSDEKRMPLVSSDIGEVSGGYTVYLLSEKVADWWVEGSA